MTMQPATVRPTVRPTWLDDDDDDEEDGDSKRAIAWGLGKKLLERRIIVVAKPVSRELAAGVLAQLLVLDDEHPEKPITMYVNSPGGDADAGFAIYDAMRLVHAPVTTVCAGLAASAAIMIFLGGDKGRRFSLPHSRFLIHQPSTGSRGQASDIEITAREIERTRDTYNGIIAAETGRKVETVLEDVQRDFWLNAAEAVEYKLVNRIVTGADDL